jgi:tetratricopeptide (TPR) repeat protein
MLQRLWQLVIVCVLASVASVTHAQFPGTAGAPQEISGTVRYAADSRPAEHVVVRCSGSGGINEQVTDANGRFKFFVTAGTYDCTVRVAGYRTETRQLTILQSGDFLDIRLREDGSPKAATSAAASVVDVNVPANARTEYDKAMAAAALGKKENFTDAAAHLEKAVSIYPKFSEAYLALGNMYAELQQYDKAEAAFRKTMELNPKAANAFFALGQMYLLQKKNEDAEKVLLQGLQIDDRSAMGHLNLARTYVAMAAKIKDENENRPFRVKAYDQVNEALKYDNEMAMAHWIKANLLISVGRDADAQKDFEEYLRIEPKGPFASSAKGFIDRIKKEMASEKKP